MNVKSPPPPSSESSDSEGSDEKMTGFENKDKETFSSTITIKLNLFILVFLAGVFTTSGVALFASAYLGYKFESSAASTNSENGKFLWYYKILCLLTFKIAHNFVFIVI